MAHYTGVVFVELFGISTACHHCCCIYFRLEEAMTDPSSQKARRQRARECVRENYSQMSDPIELEGLARDMADFAAQENAELERGSRILQNNLCELEAELQKLRKENTGLQSQLEDLKLALGTDRVTLRGQLKSAEAKLSALQEELRLAKEEEDFVASAQACGHAGRYRVARDSGDPHNPKQCCVFCELSSQEAEMAELKKRMCPEKAGNCDWIETCRKAEELAEKAEAEIQRLRKLGKGVTDAFGKFHHDDEQYVDTYQGLLDACVGLREALKGS